MKRLIFIIVLLVGCSAHREFSKRSYDAGQFTFQLPPEMQKVSLKGIDSNFSEFENSDIVLDFDYGFYSATLDQLSHNLDYKSHGELINGREAQIGSCYVLQLAGRKYHYEIMVNFKKEGLTMRANCKNEKCYATILEVFRSIRFK